jgi:uncharacterized protein
VRVVVLADTHLRREWPNRRLPDAAVSLLRTADVILHAGDITQPEHLNELARMAEVHAVLGNNDPELAGVLPEQLRIERAGVRIGMVHDSGRTKGRSGRLRRWFPDADVVVFGHSHVPWNAAGVGGQLLFNPGSPTERRRSPRHTMGLGIVEGGRVAFSRRDRD